MLHNVYFTGRLDEAFSHCAAVLKTKAFKDSLEWVACCVEIFEVRAIKSLFKLKLILFLVVSEVYMYINCSDRLSIVPLYFTL